MPLPNALQMLASNAASCERIRVGVDVVDVREVRESCRHFGQRFLQRLYSNEEVHYSLSSTSQRDERLAARFAAKEAAIKAFGLSDVGVSWRDIEVQRCADGSCALSLHGRVAAQVARLGVIEITLSLTHDGDYAAAIVAALCEPRPSLSAAVH